MRFYLSPHVNDGGISPPRDPREMPRPGYYPSDYRSVSPMWDLRRPSMGPRMSSRPIMYANMNDGPGDWMPMGEWYGREEEMPRGRRPEGNLHWDFMFEHGRFG
ncbi:uncharacterized protein K460DRAFT_353560 [Cucurbitaria berberidis CBS 394.84]|uniref:Uncharacterized protein n=1 Tax=Cucurbitaria berberidis CBS 394.84 TaxID=1168544 RepID=A0A9P4GN31_9PLEO|nr:uncharacterized protein K460DRAFT_353560 [Cucurbitaria berberidis CBS 394.84]KAF1848595.1 hypothetical protein K460DRAFT_353560 [Cucurbitaria berberidis CBS 394.84]